MPLREVIYLEVLRVLYVLSLHRWTALLIGAGVVVLGGLLFFAAGRLGITEDAQGAYQASRATRVTVERYERVSHVLRGAAEPTG